MRTRATGCAFVLLALLAGCGGAVGGDGAAGVVRLTRGAGGVGFLPLLVMEEYGLIEQHAANAGIVDLEVRWIDLGGPAIVNDALLSGSADFISAGPPAFLTLWDRTRGGADVRGVSAITSLPMYLNTHADHLRSLDDFTEQDKVAVTAIKVSIPAIIMQMHARDTYGPSEFDRFDRFTVSMTHPDGVIAMLSKAGGINAHFTSPPFHQREVQDPDIRTIMTTNQVMGGSTTFTMLSTTARYHDENPKVYAAVLAALAEAHAMIRDDPATAAQLLLSRASGDGFSPDDIVAVLDDPDISFTTTPENVMKYAEFMEAIGSISTLPASWEELFFPEIHGVPGS
jgi:NitT/TauT family transport system substrate-binding protein